METLTLVAVVTFCNISCFVLGSKMCQKTSKKTKTSKVKEVKLPSINPLKAIKEHQSKKAAEKEQSRIETIMQNIEKYDGTSRGQEDVG